MNYYSLVIFVNYCKKREKTPKSFARFFSDKRLRHSLIEFFLEFDRGQSRVFSENSAEVKRIFKAYNRGYL
jgi:hypothetical protein